MLFLRLGFTLTAALYEDRIPAFDSRQEGMSSFPVDRYAHCAPLEWMTALEEVTANLKECGIDLSGPLGELAVYEQGKRAGERNVQAALHANPQKGVIMKKRLERKSEFVAIVEDFKKGFQKDACEALSEKYRERPLENQVFVRLIADEVFDRLRGDRMLFKPAYPQSSVLGLKEDGSKARIAPRLENTAILLHFFADVCNLEDSWLVEQIPGMAELLAAIADPAAEAARINRLDAAGKRRALFRESGSANLVLHRLAVEDKLTALFEPSAWRHNNEAMELYHAVRKALPEHRGKIDLIDMTSFKTAPPESGMLQKLRRRDSPLKSAQR